MLPIKNKRNLNYKKKNRFPDIHRKNFKILPVVSETPAGHDYLYSLDFSPNTSSLFIVRLHPLRLRASEPSFCSSVTF